MLSLDQGPSVWQAQAMTESRLGILILAAGEARRFGACKQLAQFQNKPLLQHVVDAALPLPHKRLVIITGKFDEEIKGAVDSGLISGAEVVYNPNWSTGMNSAISLGCQLLRTDCNRLLVLLSDQILVSTEELYELTNSASGAGIACAGFGGTVGPPAVFAQSHYPDLLSLSAENGAKRLLTDPNNRVSVIPMQSAGWDIDSPDDLENLADVGSYIFGN